MPTDDVFRAFYEIPDETSTADFLAQDAEPVPVEDVPPVNNEVPTDNQPPVDTPTFVETPISNEPPVNQPVDEQPKPWAPEFKTDADRWMYDKILAGDEEEVWQNLNAKYAYKAMSDDDKIIAYIKDSEPGISDEDAAWEAARQYGIDVTPIDEDTATQEELDAVRTQRIAKSRVLVKANQHFTDKAQKVALPTAPNPLDVDEDYKQYKTNAAQAAQQAQEEQERNTKLHQLMESAAPTITSVETTAKFNIDDSELALPINFPLDHNRQKELLEFAKNFLPTDELAAPYRKADGFDMAGYLKSLVPIRFHQQLISTAIKQAIVKDREGFIEREHKNSSLRNNDVSQPLNEPVDAIDLYWHRR